MKNFAVDFWFEYLDRMNLRCIIKPTKTQEDVNYEKNYLDYVISSCYFNFNFVYRLWW